MGKQHTITAADAIREVSRTDGIHHTNSYIVRAVKARYGITVSQVQLIQSIGPFKSRRHLPKSLTRMAKAFLAACNSDVRLAIGVIKNAS